jgi:hypothetical protein
MTINGSGAVDTPSPARRVGRFLDNGWARVEQLWENTADTLRAGPIGRWWKSVDRPGSADWALLGAMCALALVTFLYGDVKATFEHSFNFLDAILAGRPQDFYQVAINNASFGHPAVYDVPIYAIFAIWNLPTYVLYRLGDFDYLLSTPAQLWLKLMMVVFAIVASRLLMSIGRVLGMTPNRTKWLAFYFVSSLSLFVPVFVIVQYDIIAVTFMLAGILAYLQGRTRSFLLWFLAANTLKLFALFIFIPLVLLKEKRIPRAVASILVGLLGLVLCRLLYRDDVAFEASTGGFTDLMLNRLVETGFRWQSTVPVPLFVVFMVGLAIFAYVKRTASNRELHAFAIYVSLAAFLVFCAIVPLNPYWIALVAPFSALIIFMNPRHLTLNSLLEVSISASLLIIYMLIGFQMYNASIFSDLLFGQFVSPASPQRFYSPSDILVGLGLSGNRVYFLVGFMIAGVIAVLIVNYPRRSFIADMPNREPIRRSVVWIRIGALAGFCALLFAMYLVPARSTVYSSVSSTPEISEVDLLAPGSAIEQEMRFDQRVRIERVQFGIDAGAVTWINSAVINATILDSSGVVVFEGSIPANGIGVGLATFPTDGLELMADETYTLMLTGANLEGEPAFAQINAEQNRFTTLEDGVVVDGDLVLIIAGTVVD